MQSKLHCCTNFIDKTIENKTVLLGMSGGIDSLVAALLLIEQGYIVKGVTFRTWSQTDDNNMTAEPDYIYDARMLAQKLGIVHYVVDLRECFYNSVVNYFVDGYLNGETPNPCAKCNIVFKWHFLYQLSNKYNCSFIATGHYANIVGHNNRFFVAKGADAEKEQSFFLWGLPQIILSKTILPLGMLTKTQVFKIADNNGYNLLHSKKESTGLCFITNKQYRPFITGELLKRGINIQGGNYVDSNGKIIGHHNGYVYYTIGQRRGLGLVTNSPYYVVGIEPNNNIVKLGTKNELYQGSMMVYDYFFNYLPGNQTKLTIKIRYRKQNVQGFISIIDDKKLKVLFDEPEWGIAPGQTVAFYINDMLLGGGFIGNIK